MATTLIRNASFVVAWDASTKSHTYMPDADVVYEDGVIRFVGRNYEGVADTVIDGRGFMAMPGLVNIHTHPSSEPMNKGLTDEVGSPRLYNSSLYEYLPIFRPDSSAVADCVRVALSELLLSGVTTVADLSMAHPGWLDLLAESGMRVCVAPMFRSGRWFTKNGHMVDYEWNEAAGEKAMSEAFTLSGSVSVALTSDLAPLAASSASEISMDARSQALCVIAQHLPPTSISPGLHTIPIEGISPHCLGPVVEGYSSRSENWPVRPSGIGSETLKASVHCVGISSVFIPAAIAPAPSDTESTVPTVNDALPRSKGALDRDEVIAACPHGSCSWTSWTGLHQRTKNTQA